MMVLNYAKIVVYYLNKNIAPTNVPAHVASGYKESIKYFEELAFGERNSPVLQYQPSQGTIIKFGGSTKRITFGSW